MRYRSESYFAPYWESGDDPKLPRLQHTRSSWGGYYKLAIVEDGEILSKIDSLYTGDIIDMIIDLVDMLHVTPLDDGVGLNASTTEELKLVKKLVALFPNIVARDKIDDFLLKQRESGTHRRMDDEIDS